MIRIFVATCLANKKAEIALEFSIKKHTKCAVSIHWMRNGDNQTDWNEEGWGTRFTPFRWIVPKLCNYSGKAIYLDVDTLLRGDILDLWNLELGDKAIASLPGNYSVMLMDCSKLKPIDFDISQFKASACSPPFNGMVNQIVEYIEKNDLVLPLSAKWNCLDGENYGWREARLLHYSNKSTQPWMPYPERHQYEKHKISDLSEMWQQYYEDACNVD